MKPEVSLGATFDPDLPKHALGDPLRFRQVVQNLVSNAIKFTEAGSITIHSSLVDEDETSFIVQTEVTDTGVGILETVAQDELFSPFTQFVWAPLLFYAFSGGRCSGATAKTCISASEIR